MRNKEVYAVRVRRHQVRKVDKVVMGIERTLSTNRTTPPLCLPLPPRVYRYDWRRHSRNRRRTRRRRLSPCPRPCSCPFPTPTPFPCTPSFPTRTSTGTRTSQTSASRLIRLRNIPPSPILHHIQRALLTRHQMPAWEEHHLARGRQAHEALGGRLVLHDGLGHGRRRGRGVGVCGKHG